MVRLMVGGGWVALRSTHPTVGAFCVVVRAPQQRTEERMHLIPSIAIAIAIAITIALPLAGTAQTATPDAEAALPTRASVEAPMLECHTWYADRYAKRVDAAPSENSAGSLDRSGPRLNSSP